MKSLKKPEWIKKQLFNNSREDDIKQLINKSGLHTVCQEAKCPNIGECFSKKTATFLLLGNICTRNCKFCNISTEKGSLPLDMKEPERIANAVKEMDLRYVVLTSVTRDDLSDGGASIFLETIRRIKSVNKEILIEVLVPDFKGDEQIISSIINSDITVFNHNLETIARLYPEVREMANYQLSLKVLEFAKRNNKKVIVKTGIMVGLGEEKAEVVELMHDFKRINGDMLTIGQYLPPGKKFYPVQKYVDLEDFDYYKMYAERIGISKIVSGPFVRSSYLAESYV